MESNVAGAIGAGAEDRERVLTLLRRHGWNATSFQVLERGFQYWFDTLVPACVAFVDTGRARVAAGAPIADNEHLAAVASRFIAGAHAANRRACFFATEQRFADACGCESLVIGEQPIWDPHEWEDTLRGSRSLREQIRRARAKQVTVRALRADDVLPGAPWRAGIEDLVRRWLGARTMAPMGFLVDVQPFEFAAERRYYVAEQNGRVIGFLAAVPVFDRNGWFFEDLLRDPFAPNGTAEALIDVAMRAAASEHSRYVTLGLAPLAGPVNGLLRIARERMSFLYDFHGLRAFKARLRPRAWHPIYLSHPRGTSGSLALYDSLAAFARGSFAHFAVQSVLRGPAIVVRMLGAALAPWAVLVLTPPARRFFPSSVFQHAWGALDLLVAFSLFALAGHWRPRLARVVTAVIAIDALATIAQVALFNVSRLRGVLDAAVLAVSLAAPIVAAIVMCSAQRVRKEVDA